MKQQLYLLLLLLGLSSPMLAQIDSAVVESEALRISRIFRVSSNVIYTFPLNEMNRYVKKRVTDQGLPSLSTDFTFDFSFRWKNWFFTENISLSAFGNHNRNMSVSLWLERTILKDRNYRINVYGGINNYQVTTTLRSQSRHPNKTLEFNDFRNASFGITPSLRLSGYATDVGILLLRREKRRVNGDFAIRLGYKHALQKEAWEAPGYNLIGAPRDLFRALYINVATGVSLNTNRLYE